MLVQAVEQGHVRLTKQLLAAGVSSSAADKQGCTALHYAARRGRLELVQILIAAKAPVNAAEQTGQTPLHFSAKAGHVAVVKQLLSAGAEINMVELTKCQHALHLAVCRGHAAVVKLLLGAGAAAKATDINDNDCLDFAVYHKRPNVVQLLLSSQVPDPFSTAEVAATALQAVDWERLAGAAALFKHLAEAEDISAFEQTMDLVEEDTRATLRHALLSGWHQDVAGQEARHAALAAQEEEAAASCKGLQHLAVLVGLQKAHTQQQQQT